MRNSFAIFNSIVNTLIAIGTIGATVTALWLSHQQNVRSTDDTLKINFDIAEKNIKRNIFVPFDGAMSLPPEREGMYFSIHIDNIGFINAHIISIFFTRQCLGLDGASSIDSINIEEIMIEGVYSRNINPRERKTIYVELDKIRDKLHFTDQQVATCKGNINIQTVLHGYSTAIPGKVIHQFSQHIY